MKTALIVLLAAVAVTSVSSNVILKKIERIARETRMYVGAAGATAGAKGKDAAAVSAVVDQPEEASSYSGASAKMGKVYASSGISQSKVYKSD